MNQQLLAIEQLDKKLPSWRQALHFFQPSKGWVKLLRQSLGMTTEDLARRLDVDRSRISHIEKAELDGALTLHTLKEVANALNCELTYALVPRTSLKEIINKQALKVAKNRVERVAHSMALEDQATTLKSKQKLFKEEKDRLLSGPFKYIWRE